MSADRPTSRDDRAAPRRPKVRLFVDGDLGAGATVRLGRDQSHYLATVMRAGVGDAVALFNGRDGEWRGEVTSSGRRAVELAVDGRLRPQAREPDLWLAFAPIKRARIDFLAAKATELGVSRLIPVMTGRTQTSRVNTARLRANAIEAAEQCERLTVPEVSAPMPLGDLMSAWPAGRRLLVGDESGGGVPLAAVAGELAGDANLSCAILVGPEGGFTAGELDDLANLPIVTRIGLGPRVMRADTAAIAALSVVQAIAGDWHERRRR